MDKIDFLPERVKSQRARRSRLIRQGCLLAVCLALLPSLGYVRQIRIKQARAHLGMLEERSANSLHQLDVRRSLELQQAELLTKKRIDDHLGSRISVLDVLAGLEQLLPANTVLTDLDLKDVALMITVEPARAEGSSARVAGEAKKKDRRVKRVLLELTGMAPAAVDVANFIGQLSSSPLFEDVHMGYTKPAVFRERKAREFQASCYVVR